MPQFDVFVCGRMRVEARDEIRAASLVEKLLEIDLRNILVRPEVLEIAAPQVLVEPAKDLVGMLVLGGRR